MAVSMLLWWARVEEGVGNGDDVVIRRTLYPKSTI